jgi:hypothetical protein
MFDELEHGKQDRCLVCATLHTLDAGDMNSWMHSSVYVIHQSNRLRLRNVIIQLR